MTLAPSTLPVSAADQWIHLDRSIQTDEPTCNRSAFEVMWLRKKNDERGLKLQLVDANERALLASARASRQAEELSNASWWARFGPIVGIVGVLGGITAGAFFGYAVRK